MMKLIPVPFMLLLFFFMGCKDVEKNPTNCDYGTIKEEKLCISGEYIGRQFLTSLNREVYQTPFIQRYVNFGEEYYDIELNLELLVDDLNNEDRAIAFLNIYSIVKHLKNAINSQYKKAEYLYENDYSDDLYEDFYKLKKLNEIMQAFNVSAELWQNFNEQSGQIDEISNFNNTLNSCLTHVNLTNLQIFKFDSSNENTLVLKILTIRDLEGIKALQLIREDLQKQEECTGENINHCIMQIQSNISHIYPELNSRLFQHL